jgi:hypothetical protein
MSDFVLITPNKRLFIVFAGFLVKKCYFQTSVAFGGQGLTDLYVTSAIWGDEDGSKEAGSLYRVRGLAKGVPAKNFIIA